MTWRHPADRYSWAKHTFDAGTRRLIQQQKASGAERGKGLGIDPCPPLPPEEDRGLSEGDNLSPPSAPPDNVIPFDPWSRKAK